MKILIVGKGAREHALCWKAKQSPLVETVYVAPGNAGIEDAGDGLCVDISELDNEGLVAFAKAQQIDLTIVGPEDSLMNGIVDCFLAKQLMIWGPTKLAARIEGSKSFAKSLMEKYQVATADYQIFTDVETAKAYIETHPIPVVIKADGLAAGKGVVVATTKEMALDAAKEMLLHHKFGQAGAHIVVEEFLEGPEYSFMAFVHQAKIYPMIMTQDHKRAFDGDKGPNTGGMGAYGPVFENTSDEVRQILKNIMEPIVQGMANDGIPFTGFLYGGLIQTKTGFKVIEFNARFGDPETEIILPLLKSDLILHLTEFLQHGKLLTPIEWEDACAVGVVLAAEGYPEKPQTNQLIKLSQPIDELDTQIFYAGVKAENNQLYTNGGRVLICVSKAKTFEAAYNKVYNEINKIEANQTFYRHDIGHQRLNLKVAERK